MKLLEINRDLTRLFVLVHSCLVFEVASVIFSSEKLGGPTAWALCTEGASLGLGNGGKTLLMHFEIPTNKVTDWSK